MKKCARQLRQRVQFGEPEDILSSSFLNDDSHHHSEKDNKKNQEIHTRVVTALKTDDLPMLNDICTEIPDVTDVYLGRPLAHMAAELGGLKILQKLVNTTARPSVNAVSKDGDATTPLYWAIKEGHTEVVDWLLSNGAHHSPLNVSYDTAVYIAVYYNQINLLDILEAHRCSCDIPNKCGDLPLRHVIQVGNIIAFERLIQMGVDLYGWYSQENFRHTLLSDALMYQRSPCTSSVLNCLLNRPSFNAFAHQPMINQLLMMMIEKDDVEAMVLLLKHLDRLGEEFAVILTTLQKECIKGSALNCLREVIKHQGTSPSILTSVGRHHSAQVLQTFLENDARVILQKDIVRHCLAPRSRHGPHHGDVIAKLQLLIDHGYKMNTLGTDPLGSPVFHVTTRAIPCALLFLLRIGSDATSSFGGMTPLAQALVPLHKHQILLTGQLKVAIMLLEYLPTHNDPAIKIYMDHCKNRGEPWSLMRNFCVPNYTDGRLCRLLRKKSTNPRPLQHLSRIVILRALGTNSFKAIYKLGLPTRMVEYVMLHDLEEFVRVVRKNSLSDHVSNVHSCFK